MHLKLFRWPLFQQQTRAVRRWLRRCYQRRLKSCLLVYFFLVASYKIFEILLVNVNLFEKTDFVGNVGSCSSSHPHFVSCQQNEHRQIDAVYTWVNGSDEVMQAELKRISNQQTALKLGQFCHHQHSALKVSSNNSTNSSCSLLPLMLLRPQLLNPQHYFDDVLKFEKWNDSATLIYLHSLNAARTLGTDCVCIIDGRLYKLTNLYSCNSADVKADLNLTSIFSLTTSNTEKEGCEFSWSDPLKSRWPVRAKQLQSLQVEMPNVFLYTSKMTALQSNVSKIAVLLQAKKASNECNFVQVQHPFPVQMTDGAFFEHQLKSESVRRNRFADNDELRYSLRSLERFAPWIRNVFLVTNGQIPRWLNVEHPRLRLVQHRDIFPNQSHLPTFSSSAIECHLHRIANLSKQFLYLNDDIILGKPVYPDDFYTESKGFKVYLSWPVPNCAEGCPLNWLNDGYCDKACNSSKCLWDGGDCLRTANGTAGSNSSSVTSANAHYDSASSTNTDLCAPNCLTNWLGDGFCDQVCNNEHCAYDMADCGVGQLEITAEQIQVNQTGNVYTYHANSTILVLNFTHFTSLSVNELYHVKLVKAQYQNVTNIFSAVLNLKHNILTVLLRQNVTQVEPLTFTITARINQRMFNFSLFVDVQREKKTTLIKEIEPKFNLTQVIQQLEANVSLARQWNSSPTDSALTTLLSENTDHQQKTETSEFSLPCNIDIASMGPQISQKFEQIEHQLKSGLVTGSGKEFFYSQLKQLYADIICNSTTKQTSKVGRPESAMNHFMGQYLLKSINESNVFRSRHLLDAYADSLIYVNHMYNQVFGVQSRQVVAHMPHYIDVAIVERMQTRFRDHFEQTSASHFRHSEDMQFSFSYFHFLMSETEECNVEEALRLFDTDQSNTLSLNELKTLAIQLTSLPLTEENSLKFYSDLSNCSCCCLPQCNLPPAKSNRSIWQQELQVDLPIDLLLLNCTFLKEKIASKWPKRNRNHFETLNDDEVAFKMLRSNVTLLEEELNELRNVRRKFICLNDNLEHGLDKDADSRLHDLLQKFFTSLLPVPSAFERSEGKENRYLYIDQYREWKQSLDEKSGLYFRGSYLFFIINVILFIMLLK